MHSGSSSLLVIEFVFVVFGLLARVLWAKQYIGQTHADANNTANASLAECDK